MRIENFWLRYEMAASIISSVWSEHEEPSGDLNPVELMGNKIFQVHSKLREWHRKRFGKMNVELEACKLTILFFDKVEESRPLISKEFLKRQQMREKAYEISNNLELRWQQRSRCNWLSHGDHNTRYFHAYASARLRKNSVSLLEIRGSVITDAHAINNAFRDHIIQVLGTDLEALQFCPQVLYPINEVDLTPLQAEFTEFEVEAAVQQLPSNKAVGPDGLPHEFIKNYWPLVKGEVMDIFQAFFNNEAILEAINMANIVMIPKKDGAKLITDFSPISIINLVPKLIAKVLSNRLRAFLPQLISPNQTAFVKGRHIAENFISTREILQHISSSGRSAVFAKIDFSKAFDSVN